MRNFIKFTYSIFFKNLVKENVNLKRSLHKNISKKTLCISISQEHYVVIVYKINTLIDSTHNIREPV